MDKEKEDKHNAMVKRIIKKKRRRKWDRKERQERCQKKWRGQDKWGGSRRVYSAQRSERSKTAFGNDNYTSEHKDNHSYTGEMNARIIDNQPQNNGSYQENRGKPFEMDENTASNAAIEQRALPQRERFRKETPLKMILHDRSESTNGHINPLNTVGNVNDVVLNIKTEKTDSQLNKDKNNSSRNNDSDESSTDSTIQRLHTAVNSVLSSNPLKKSLPKINIKREKRSSSSSSSSDSSSDSDTNKEKTIPAQTTPAKKSSSEEDVIYMGKLERKENLVDDEDEDMPLPMEDEKVCFLCEKPGHVAFQCFTVCTNCNGQYHGLKNCPQPPNISLVLKFFIQFCIDQVCKYDPNSKFNSHGYQQINPQLFSNHGESMESIGNNFMNRKRRNSNDAGSSVSNGSRKRYEDSTTEDSESSSDENIRRKIKRRSKAVSDFDVPQQMSYTPAAYAASLPFALNPSAMGINPAMNHLLALGQMMGYNNPLMKRIDKSKKK